MPYVQASTANPLGRRNWKPRTRLSYYLPNTFAVPTAGRGPFLLEPGVTGRPAANGGLGDGGPNLRFPNLPQMQGRHMTRTVFAANAPENLYPLTHAVRYQLSGLGAAPQRTSIRVQRSPITGGTVSASGTNSGRTGWRRQYRQQQQGGSTPTGYTAAGAAIYGSPQPGSWQNAQQSQARGYYGNPWTAAQAAQQAQSGGAITGYDAAGNPIYSSAPAGLYQVGTDAYGTPIYSAVAPSSASTTTGAAAVPTSATGADWFSEDSLGLGLNNGLYLAIGGGALLLILSKRR